MPTLAEIAERQAARKLRQAGLNPDGSEPNDQRRNPKNPRDQVLADDGDDGDDPNLGGDGDDLELDGDGGDGGDDGHGDEGDGDGDDTQLQIRQLREQLGALQGRLTPAQQDLEDLRRVATTQRQQLDTQRQQYEDQINDLRAQLEKRELEEIDPTEFLSEDERADIDPAVLRALGKMAGGLAKRMTPKVDARGAALQVLQEQEQNRIKQYRNRVLTDPSRGLHKLNHLAQDQKFLAWTQKDDNDVDSAVRSLLAADSTEEIDRYARILQRKISRYQEEQKDPASRRNSPAGARTSLSTAMRRSPGKKLSDVEMKEKLREANRLARSRNPTDRAAAQKILDSLQ